MPARSSAARRSATARSAESSSGRGVVGQEEAPAAEAVRGGEVGRGGRRHFEVSSSGCLRERRGQPGNGAGREEAGHEGLQRSGSGPTGTTWPLERRRAKEARSAGAAASPPERRRSSATPSRENSRAVRRDGERRTSRPPQRPRAASEPSDVAPKEEAGPRGVGRGRSASDEKSRGFSMYGPPSSGQKTSQLPQSLQASAQFAIWCGEAFAPPSESVRSPPRLEPAARRRRGRGTRSSAAGSRTRSSRRSGRRGRTCRS